MPATTQANEKVAPHVAHWGICWACGKERHLNKMGLVGIHRIWVSRAVVEANLDFYPPLDVNAYGYMLPCPGMFSPPVE